MASTFNYPKPIKPQVVRELDALRRQFNRGLRATDMVGGLLLATRALIGEMELGRRLTDEELEEIREYNRQVDRYNRAVDEYNSKQRQARQATANRREVAAVRAAACSRCYSTHAGEC